MADMVSAALWYAHHKKWHVFPLRPGTKLPATEHGFQDATTDEAQIRAWWATMPDANIGLATGLSNVPTIDVDVKHGAPGMESWRDLRQELGPQIEDTVINETPTGGMHVLFRGNGQRVRNSASKLGPGLDVRADGGYIVVPPSKTPDGEYRWAMGCDPAHKELAPMPASILAKLAETAEVRASGVERVMGDQIAHGTQHHTLVSLAGTMRARGMGVDEIEAALWETNTRRCEVPAPRENIRRIAESVCGLYKPDPVEYSRTDMGNARRFVDQHGDTLRFNHSQARWLVWDGQRWNPDMDGEAQRLAKATVTSMYDELATYQDKDQHDAFKAFIKRSESRARLESMLAVAESEPEVAITQDALDAHPWLLNCLNGVLDLRTGTLGAHDPTLLLTKIAPVAYEPGAESELWTRFLRDSTRDDEEMVAFLARAVGYTLTGDIREEKLFFVHGPTNSGKSTFLEAIKACLGDYATTADFETFLARSFVGGPRPDIARLAGARFVASIEVDEGKHLAEGLVKQITGGDTIAARFLYQETFEFLPQFKLWLAANHAPEVKHDDLAMWRRILRLPFDVTVPKEKRDPTLKTRLKNDPAERSAVLAWAMRGCLDWQAQGLNVPMRVELATQEYRRTQDPLADFVDAYAMLSENLWTSASALRGVYEAWARESGAEIMRGKRWADALRNLGCESDRRRISGKLARGWAGIGLVDGQVEAEPEQSELEEIPF